jgi:hypothetical protein
VRGLLRCGRAVSQQDSSLLHASGSQLQGHQAASRLRLHFFLAPARQRRSRFLTPARPPQAGYAGIRDFVSWGLEPGTNRKFVVSGCRYIGGVRGEEVDQSPAHYVRRTLLAGLRRH